MCTTPIFTLHIDEKGFVYVGGVKIARYIPERRTLQFRDDNRHRSVQRGSQYVEVSISEFIGLTQKATKR